MLYYDYKLLDESLADISWLFSVLWDYSHKNDQSLEYFQQAYGNKHSESAFLQSQVYCHTIVVFIGVATVPIRLCLP